MMLIVISTPDGDTGEPDIVNHMFEAGLDVFHLRKPGWRHARMRWYIERIAPEFHPRLTLHSHAGLVGEYHIGGVHFPEWACRFPEDEAAPSPMADLHAQRPDLRISTSMHSLTDLEPCDPAVQYVLFSPVFPSISKPGYLPAVSEDEIARALARTRYRVVALGGVTVQNIAAVHALGFAGCAVIGAVWKQGRPVDNCRALLAEVHRVSTAP